MKNSANTNLLILDEIFDSSLDVSGTDDFMKILRAFSEDSNVFVISHKPDAMQDRFESVLVVEKKQNFSTIRYELNILIHISSCTNLTHLSGIGIATLKKQSTHTSMTTLITKSSMKILWVS